MNIYNADNIFMISANVNKQIKYSKLILIYFITSSGFYFAVYEKHIRINDKIG